MVRFGSGADKSAESTGSEAGLQPACSSGPSASKYGQLCAASGPWAEFSYN